MNCKIVFFFNDTATTEIYTLSLHDALPISKRCPAGRRTRKTASGSRICCSTDCFAGVSCRRGPPGNSATARNRSEEHTSELQSQSNLVCRLLLEKKKYILITL